MRKLLALLITVACLPSSAFAAIAFDNVAHSTTTSLPMTFSEVNGGNFVNVCIGEYNNPGNTYTVTGVTYGGITMTQVGETGTNNQFAADYVLPNAPTGANNVVVSGTTGSNGFDVAVSSYSGVDTVTGYDVANNTSLGPFTGGHTITASLTPTHANEWVIDCGFNDAFNISATSPVGGTFRYLNGNELELGDADTNGAAVPQSVASYGLTTSGSGTLNLVVLSIFPSTAAPVVQSPYYSIMWW